MHRLHLCSQLGDFIQQNIIDSGKSGFCFFPSWVIGNAGIHFFVYAKKTNCSDIFVISKRRFVIGYLLDSSAPGINCCCNWFYPDLSYCGLAEKEKSGICNTWVCWHFCRYCNSRNTSNRTTHKNSI